MRSKNAAGFILLSILTLGSWYLAESLRDDDDQLRTTTGSQAGYYLKSARILGTGDDGSLLYEIEAEYAEQRNDNEMEFQNVEIVYTSAAAVPWILNADKAVIVENRRQINLSGHVIAISNEGFSGDATEIRTQYLELEPDNFKAWTEERVQIRIGARSITATGMLVMLQTNQLHLKSNVRGKFVP